MSAFILRARVYGTLAVIMGLAMIASAIWFAVRAAT
jgi:hypothetical protein